jgi:Tfp pilus assembly protein PilF
MAKLIIALMLILLPSVASAHYEGELLPDSVAVMEYSMVISMAPRDTLTRNKLGMVYLRQNKVAKAKEQFKEILKIDPGNFDALDSMGLACDKEGRYKEAAEWYGRALKVKAGDAGVKKRYETALNKAKGR